MSGTTPGDVARDMAINVGAELLRQVVRRILAGEDIGRLRVDEILSEQTQLEAAHAAAQARAAAKFGVTP